jgi:hypothetical protein
VKRAVKIIFGLVLLALLVLFAVFTRPLKSAANKFKQLLNVTNVNQNVVSVSTNHSVGLPANPPEKTKPLIGEQILIGYATAASTPENDLTLMAHLMDNFTLLVKSSAQLPMSVNEDWAAAFRGKNPAHETFLPDTHVAFNAQGQLVDRWGTPLFFHALGGHRFEIRSAGPDKKMWTDDDLHHNADGTFRRSAELNPPSLLKGN